VIDTATNAVTSTVLVGVNPEGIAVTPSDARVYVANYTSWTVSVIETASNTVIDTITVGRSPVAFGQFIGPKSSTKSSARIPTLSLLATLALAGGLMVATIVFRPRHGIDR
jgi:YVTN family beta-propeller protein